ncbi:hypothetical protein TYRP_018286 [Tyrophagus putrescentiae]|nr:hypothetical protein TYRP_018286 [Tyrophagus putrescentiae]
MEDDTIKNQIISCHIGNSVNGLKALSDNQSLAQSIRETQLNCACPKKQTLLGKFGKLLLPSGNFSNNANNNTSTFSEIDQIEQDRAEAKRRLEVAVKKLCKKSAKALKKPIEKNRQKAQQTLENLNFETEIFYHRINHLSEQFAKLNKAIGQNGDIDPDFAPTAIYTPSTLKVLTAEIQLEMERTNKLPLATIIEEDEGEFATTMPSLDFSPSNPVYRPSPSTIHPKYIIELLAKVCDRLSPLSNYELNVMGVFGCGAQSTVHQAWLKANGSKGSAIALKVQLVTARRFRDVLTEVNLIGGETAVLRHQNILTASRCSLFKSHSSGLLGYHFYMALAFEPMADGSLADYVYDYWLEPFVACLMLQLLPALSYIHAQGIVHDNIKPDNILLNNGTVKIADFGKAMYLKEEQEEAQGRQGKTSAIRYTAPEKARARLDGGNSKQDELSTALDIWALGATLYELLEGKCPYHKYDSNKVLLAISTHGLFLTRNEKYSPTLKSFFSLMTQFKPADRPSADVLLADPFIAKASTPSELAAFIKKLKDDIQLTK